MAAPDTHVTLLYINAAHTFLRSFVDRLSEKLHLSLAFSNLSRCSIKNSAQLAAVINQRSFGQSGFDVCHCGNCNWGTLISEVCRTVN